MLPRCLIQKLRLLACLLLLVLPSLLIPQQAQAQCPTTLSVAITQHPYLLVDSNNPASGPQVTMVRAAITNTGANVAENVFAYIGDGITPGTFPAGTDGRRLGMLGGVGDATRYIVNLAPGESKDMFWFLTYPLTNTQTYSFTVWANNEDGCFAQASHSMQTQSTISAAANKMLGTVTIDPPSGIVNVGNTLTVTVSNFNFGTIGDGQTGQQFVWMQPAGNLDFDPTCFRLVRTEVNIQSISNVPPYGPMPYYNRLYFPGIKTQNPPPNYNSATGDYVKYTFVALKECATTIKVYQEASSGQQEKYAADYGQAPATRLITGQGGTINLQKSVEPEVAAANDNLTWTITYINNTDFPVGDPSTGNALTVIDESIPSDTTYVAGSAGCSGSCIIWYSTDNGATWTTTEPAPNQVTKLKWYINEVVPPHSSGSVWFQSVVNLGYPGGEPICNTASARIGEGATMATETACANAGVDLELNKTVDDQHPCEGEEISYTLTLTNVGASEATNIEVTDLLPVGVTYSSHSASQGTFYTGPGLWDVGNLAPDASCTLNIVATVDSGTGGAVIVNSGSVTHLDQTDTVPGNNYDSIQVNVHTPPDCTITAADSVCAGSTGNIASVPDAGVGATYNWNITNGMITAGSNTRQITWTAGTSSPAHITINLTDADGCQCSGAKDVAIDVCANNPPSQPSNVSPVSGGCASLPVTLESSDFSDPDPGDTHAASQWQIRTSTGSYGTPIFDSGRDTGNLTSIIVPPGILSYSASYCWRVRHQDSGLLWADYSAESCFSTKNTPGGGNVTVNLNGAAVTYDYVSSDGCTFMTSYSQNPGGSLPPGLCALLPYMDITTTATYSGSVTVALVYNESLVPDENTIRLLHWNGAIWEDVTTSLDTVNNIVYGEVSTLSPFCIGYACGAGGGGGVPAFPNLYIGIGTALGAGLLAYLVRRRLLAR